MKKIFKIMLTFLLFVIFSFESLNAQTSSKILIAYFSWSGNSRTLAEYAREVSGGDIFEIAPINPYPSQYRMLTEQARKEIDENIFPEIRNKVNNISKYDTIILCYPIWSETMPNIVKKFLTDYDFSAKTIAPACTHAGSRMGNSIDDIKILCPNSRITDGFDVYGSAVERSKKNIENWINKIVLNK